MSRDQSIDVDGSVVDLAIEYPQLLSILQGLGIDYTCGGRSLRISLRPTRPECLRCRSALRKLPTRKRTVAAPLTDAYGRGRSRIFSAERRMVANECDLDAPRGVSDGKND